MSDKLKLLEEKRAEARMGGGSVRNADGSYKSGDAWGWSAMKPFPSSGGPIQVYQNVAIPGFWTDTMPTPDGKSWTGRCAERFNPNGLFVPGFYEKAVAR